MDRGGYARYDFRTATRLQGLAEAVDERHQGRIEALGRKFTAYGELREALDALSGWGPVTIQLFLRELRGVWPGATSPLDERAELAADHLGLVGAEGGCSSSLQQLHRLARASRLEFRDLESGLVRLALAHHGRMDRCPGGASCVRLDRPAGGDEQ